MSEEKKADFSAKERKAVMTVGCMALIAIIAALVLKFFLTGSEPPEVRISNGSDTAVTFRGSYEWKTGIVGGSWKSVDTLGPLELYEQGKLEGIEPAGDGSFSLKFGMIPDSVDVVIFPEDSAAAGDYGAMISRDVSGAVSGYMFTVPRDGVYIINILAVWDRGSCYYYCYSTP